ncbi:MAG: anhydro-N-acetylmuramic acid kinase [Alphaproteobacteria bacterium]|nr:anhydro-N-acetylmuramic acid kinase [Alphaproteobacteria bacterium]
MLAIGLMSGTSLDGIDAALIETDGERVFATGAALTAPYAPALRERVRALLGGAPPDRVAPVEADLTDAHAAAVEALLARSGTPKSAIGVVGFHGHTIDHAPAEGRTWQIGDGARLARALGLTVVADFRSADVAAGGEGAPLAPLFHAALAHGLERPLAVLNLGGVGNVTWIGPGDGADGDLLAFDTGPGNALLDDWVRRHTGALYDADGATARAGQVRPAVVDALLAHPYFARRPPKSLDRNTFAALALDGLSVADGAATLVACTAATVAAARDPMPAAPARWIVCGGGRRNPAIMDALRSRLGVAVDPAEAVGWDGDALEAQAFGFLAVRALRGLPLSVPGTTGVRVPTPGGRRFGV